MKSKINLRAHLPEWLTNLFPAAIWRIPGGGKVIYLTFDDGPVPEVTPEVLDILDKFQIKATFFCVGENVEKYPALYKQIKDRGHAVGNHTYNHVRGFKTTNKAYLENIEKAGRLIKSNLFRPPHGTLKPSQYRAIIAKYRLVMWDVISCDYDPTLKPQQCLANVINFVREGSIITFHDSIKAKTNVLATLPLAIEYLIKEGYSFRKISFPDNNPVTIKHRGQVSSKIKQSINRLRKGA